MWAYTAAGYGPNGYVASGFQVEYNHTWDPLNYDDLHASRIGFGPDGPVSR